MVWYPASRCYLVCLLVVLTAIQFTAHGSHSTCVSTRHNSTCEYYVCASNCSSFGIPLNALVYSTVDQAIQAVADESKGSYSNTIWLVENGLYLLDSPENGFAHLDIRGLYPDSVGFRPPKLRTLRNVHELSSSLLLADLQLSSPSDFAVPHCINTGVYNSSIITILGAIIDCPIWISGTTHAKFERTILPGLFFVSTLRGSLLLQEVTYSHAGPIGMYFEDTRAQIIDSKLECIWQVYVLNSTFELASSTVAGPIVIDTNTTESIIEMERNVVQHSVIFQGVSWSANLTNNVINSYEQYVMSSIYGYPTKAVAQWAPVAVFSAVCDSKLVLANNTFLNGTLYLDFPTTDSKQLFCPSTPYNAFSELTITRNRFPNRSFQYGILGISLHGKAPPAIVVNSKWSHFKVNHAKDLVAVKAHGNWWGSDTGPHLCCNPQGAGTFAATFVDASYWCHDPDCNSSSPSQLPTECYMRGCSIRFPKGFVVLVAICGVIMFSVTITTIIYALFVNRHRFSPEEIRYQETEELIMQSAILFHKGLAASSLASVCVITICALMISSYHSTHQLPMQQSLYPVTYQTFLVLLSVSVLQIALNIYSASSMILRRQLPGNLKFSLRFFAFCNAVFLCLTALFGFSYLPSLYHSSLVASTDGPRSQGALGWFLFSPLNNYAFLPIFGTVLASLSCMIPARVVYNLLCYPEYARMSITVETALLSKVVRIPSVIRISLGPVIVSSVGLLLGVGVVITELVMFINPSVYYERSALAQRALIPAGFIRIQYGIGLVFTLIGVVAQVTSIWSTRRVRPVGIYTVTSLFILVAIISSTSFFSIYMQAIGHRQHENKNWAVASLSLECLWLVCLLANFFLLRIVRRRIIRELPKYALEGINDHMDDIWHNTPAPTTASHFGEATKLLSNPGVTMTTSEDESPIF